MNTTAEQTSPQCRQPAWSTEIDQLLVDLLGRHGVHFEACDSWTARFGAVPLSPKFSKRRTNILLRRLERVDRAGAYVDGDLAYRGRNPVVRAALSGPCRRNWRRLRTPLMAGSVTNVFAAVLDFLSSPLATDVRSTLEQLAVIGSRASPVGSSLLTCILEPVTRQMACDAYRTSFRKPLARRVAALTTRSVVPRSVLLWGEAGCGKDELMLAAAHPLLDAGVVETAFRLPAVRLAAGCLGPSELEISVLNLLDEMTTMKHSLLIIQDFDLLFTETPVSRALWTHAMDHGLRLLATVRSPHFLDWLSNDAALARRIVPLQVPPATGKQTLQVLEAACADSTLEVAPETLRATIQISNRSSFAQPAAALSHLAGVLGEANWRRSKQVGPDDAYAIEPTTWPELSRKE